MPRWHEAIIQDISQLTPNVRSFRLKVPELEKFEFQAGQFVTFDLPIGDKRLQRWRSYSIASAPGSDNALELCIVRSAEGLGTRYLFEEVGPGDTLKFKGPDGAFFLPENIQKDIVLICTGTGVAPFRSMLLDIQQRKIPHRNIHLIFGTRTEADILYRDEFEALVKTLPGFRYDVALSREPDWLGWKGYVHQIYTHHYAEKRPDVQFYLCGWSNMIDEAVAELIVKLGYDRTQVVYELYG